MIQSEQGLLSFLSGLLNTRFSTSILIDKVSTTNINSFLRRALTAEIFVVIVVYHWPGSWATKWTCLACALGAIPDSIGEFLRGTSLVCRSAFETRHSNDAAIELRAKVGNAGSLITTSVMKHQRITLDRWRWPIAQSIFPCPDQRAFWSIQTTGTWFGGLIGAAV